MNGENYETANEVVAQVIDDELMFSQHAFEIDMSGIQRDIQDLTLAIDEALTVYGDMLVEPAVIAEMPFEQARRCERAVSGAVRRADELRRKLNRDYKVPLDRAKLRYDELMGPVIELHAAYRQRRLDLEEAERTAKRQAIQAVYENAAPHIALLLPGQDEPLVPFERIFERFGDKWLNKTATMESIELEIGGIVRNIAEGEAQLRAAELTHVAEAQAAFYRTLDAEAAIAHDQQLCAMEQRQAVLEAQRDAGLLPGQSGEAPQPPCPPAEPNPQVAPNAAGGVETAAEANSQGRKPRVMLIDGATDDECRRIGAFCRELGITGVFKGEQFYQAVQSLLQ